MKDFIQELTPIFHLQGESIVGLTEPVFKGPVCVYKHWTLIFFMGVTNVCSTFVKFKLRMYTKG